MRVDWCGDHLLRRQGPKLRRYQPVARFEVIMDRNQLLLALALRESNIPISVEEFDNRLLVQKAVYLLQQRGVELGYPYSWYVRGPYSSRLANDLFFLANLDADGKQELGKYTFGKKTKALIGEIWDLFQPNQRLHERAKRLELLASVLFLFKTGQATPDEEDSLVSILKANGKNFGTSEVHQAVGSLRSSGYTF
jgi:uncharacterized protein YwgA